MPMKARKPSMKPGSAGTGAGAFWAALQYGPTLSRLDWLRLITRGLSRTPYRP